MSKKWSIELPDSGPKVTTDIWRGGSAEAYEFVLNAMNRTKRPELIENTRVKVPLECLPELEWQEQISTESAEVYAAIIKAKD